MSNFYFRSGMFMPNIPYPYTGRRRPHTPRVPGGPYRPDWRDRQETPVSPGRSEPEDMSEKKAAGGPVETMPEKGHSAAGENNSDLAAKSERNKDIAESAIPESSDDMANPLSAVFNLDPENIVQGIIFSEILGKPKSRMKNRW